MEAPLIFRLSAFRCTRRFGVLLKDARCAALAIGLCLCILGAGLTQAESCARVSPQKLAIATGDLGDVKLLQRSDGALLLFFPFERILHAAVVKDGRTETLRLSASVPADWLAVSAETPATAIAAVSAWADRTLRFYRIDLQTGAVTRLSSFGRAEELRIDPSLTSIDGEWYATSTQVTGKANNADPGGESGQYRIALLHSRDLQHWDERAEIVNRKQNLEDAKLYWYPAQRALALLYEAEEYNQGPSVDRLRLSYDRGRTWNSETVLVEERADNEPGTLVRGENDSAFLFSSDRDRPGTSYPGALAYWKTVRNGDFQAQDNPAELPLPRGSRVYDALIRPDGSLAIAAIQQGSTPELLLYSLQCTLGEQTPRPESWRGSLYSPTMITKTDRGYLLVDSWHHRVLWSESLAPKIEDWHLLDENLAGPHSVATDGSLYLVEDTQRGAIAVYEWVGASFRRRQSLADLGSRPHRVRWDPASKSFYVLAANSQELFRLERETSGSLRVAGREPLPFLQGAYTRSFTIQDDAIYFTSGPNAIIKAVRRGDHLEETDRYPVPAGFESMNDLFYSGSYWYLTATFAKIGRIRDLELLKSEHPLFEDIYAQLGLCGTPYYLTRIGGRIFVPQTTEYSGIVSFKEAAERIEDIRQEFDCGPPAPDSIARRALLISWPPPDRAPACAPR